MVNGQFQCIGPPQHLKNRFGEGYTLTIRVADENMEMNYSAFENFGPASKLVIFGVFGGKFSAKNAFLLKIAFPALFIGKF